MNEVDEFMLEHFGTKGMKWGVRRKERKAVKSRRREIVTSERKKADLKTRKETADLRAKAMGLAKKYDFDQDDGGGGTTRDSKKAGAQYMKLWDKVYEIEMKNRNEAGQNVTKRMLKEFGEQKLKDLRVHV